ncbi:MAG: glycosyltransferase [Pseudomonadota bacterium]
MKKALVMILAYNAERHIASVLDRIPEKLWNNPDYLCDIVVIDDCSKDHTSQVAREYIANSHKPIKLLRNKLNQAYGGNQKVGYTYAIDNDYDAVVMVHGDGQYPPEFISEMIEPILNNEADAVFGSRMINKKDALAGGMPYYKFAGNIALTTIQNAMIGSRLSEFHSGFRAYSINALKKIPFQYNSNVFHFDTDIIIQLVDNGLKIKEIPIPTHYGDEVCHVNGMRYAFDVMISTIQSRIQKFGILYDPKFDYDKSQSYPDKTGFESSHSFAIKNIENKQRVLNIGLEEKYSSNTLKNNGFFVDDFDWYKNEGNLSSLNSDNFDAILILDVIEHLPNPELFMENLHKWCVNQNPKIIITTPNIAFFIQRIMLLFGQFNYGKRGILDKTHTRLFTFASLRRIIRNSGYNLVSIEGIPAPFPVAFGDNIFSRVLLKINCLLIKISKTIFSYQIAAIIRPIPTLKSLVEQAIEHGDNTKL